MAPRKSPSAKTVGSWSPVFWLASAWALTFPGATWSLALLFRRTTVAAEDVDHVARVASPERRR